MKTKYIASMLALLLLASVFTFSLTINKASAADTTISIPSVSKTPSDLGHIFTVPVEISNVADLFGFDIKITWDNTLITFAGLSSNAGALWSLYFEPLPSPGYQTGDGYVRYAAVAEGGSGYTNAGPTTLFTITFTVAKAGNIPYSMYLHFDTVKLSDHNADTITATPTDGPYTMSATVPALEFVLIDPNPAKQFEYGKYFEIQVFATYITSTLTGYDLKIDYTSELLAFYGMHWGVLGTGTVDTSTSGVVEVSKSGGTPSTGDNILLFTLTFNVTFDDRVTHVWKTSTTPNTLAAQISLDTTYGYLNFVEGVLNVNSGPTSITLPAPQNLTIYLIQGDVNCDGYVDSTDLRGVAAYYDWTSASAPPQLDVRVDSNNVIDIYDLVIVAHNFGYHVADSPPS